MASVSLWNQAGQCDAGLLSVRFDDLSGIAACSSEDGLVQGLGKYIMLKDFMLKLYWYYKLLSNYYSIIMYKITVKE